MEIKSPVAKLERVPLREIWGDEARNFTPWLATDEALSLLSKVIGGSWNSSIPKLPWGLTVPIFLPRRRTG